MTRPTARDKKIALVGAELAQAQVILEAARKKAREALNTRDAALARLQVLTEDA